MQRRAPDAHAPARPGGPQSVGRVFAMLDCIAARQRGMTLSELAAAVGAPKTSLASLLAGLAAEGCLLRDGAARYSLGPRIHGLAMQAMAGRELAVLARPFLRALAESTGETAVIGALAPDAPVALYLDKVESVNPIRYAVAAGERRELYCTALGKVLLAHFDAQRLKRYVETTPRPRFTRRTIVEAGALLKELANIRRDGIARTQGERVPEASGLAAPVFGAGGSVAGALLIAGPSARMRANARRNERLLRAAAAQCTRYAGGSPAAFRRTGRDASAAPPAGGGPRRG